MKVLSPRALLPGPGRVLFAALLLAATLFMSLQLRNMRPEAIEWLQAIAWTLGGFLWWILVVARSCCLAYGMLSLRLPGVVRVLVAGAGLSLALCMVLPLLVLYFACADASLGLLGGALLLGCALGALILAMPNYPWIPALVPLSFLVAAYYPLWWPETAREYWGLALAIIGLVASLWTWLCRPGRGWQPLAINMDAPARVALQQTERRFYAEMQVKTGLRCTSPARRLVEVLGPGLKGPSQWYSGWRGWLPFVLSQAGCLSILIWIGPATVSKVLLVIILVVIGLLLAQMPARYWLGEQARSGQALLAEVLLLPGLPGAGQLLWRMSWQMLRGLLEKLLLLGLMFGLVAWYYGFPGVWLQWFALWLLFMLPLGLLQALLVYGRSTRPWYWMAVDALMFISGIASSSLLLWGDGSAAVWLLPAWLAVGLVLVGMAVIAFRALQRRGTPFFS